LKKPGKNKRVIGNPGYLQIFFRGTKMYSVRFRARSPFRDTPLPMYLSRSRTSPRTRPASPSGAGPGTGPGAGAGPCTRGRYMPGGKITVYEKFLIVWYCLECRPYPPRGKMSRKHYTKITKNVLFIVSNATKFYMCVTKRCPPQPVRSHREVGKKDRSRMHPVTIVCRGEKFES